MGTQIQSETYFLRHCSSNLNRSISTGRWMSYQGRKVAENCQHGDSSSPWRGLMGRYPEQETVKVKETILEHEVTFRHQVRELHRLYRRQKELMNAIQDNGLYKIQEKTESSQLLILPSYMSSGSAKRTSDTSHFLSSGTVLGRLDPSSSSSGKASSNVLKRKNYESFNFCGDMYLHKPVDLDISDGARMNKDETVVGRRSFGLVGNGVSREDRTKEFLQERYTNSTLNNAVKYHSSTGDSRSNVQSNGRNYLGYLKEPLQFLSRPSSVESSFNLSSHVDKLDRRAITASANSGFSLHKGSSQYSMPVMNGNKFFSGSPSDCHGNEKEVKSYGFKLSNDLSLHAEHRTENRKKRKIFGVEIAEEVDERSLVSLDAFNSYPRSNGAESDTSPILPKKAFTSHLSKMVGSPSEPSWLKLGSCLQNLELVGGANAAGALKSSFPKRELFHQSSLFVHPRLNPELTDNGATASLKGKNSFTSLTDLFESHDSSSCWKSVKSEELKARQFLKLDSEITNEAEENKDGHTIGKRSDFPSTEMIGCTDAMDVSTDGVSKKLPTLFVAIPSAREKSLSKYLSGMRYQIDLNLSIDEGEDPPAAVVPAVPEKIIRSEIGLQVPALIESEVEHRGTKFPVNSEESHQYLIEKAAEALVIISLAQTNYVSSFANSRLESTSNSLHWFADVISSYTSDQDGCSDEEAVTGEMDYFEFMTLRLKDVKEETYSHGLSEMEHQKAEETEISATKRRPERVGRRGRQRKDFQKGVMPDLVSLAKQDVDEDIHTLAELFHSTGKTWKSGISKRNAAKHGHKGMKSGESLHTTEENSSKQKQTGRELQLRGRSFTGWGKKTRRVPRKRCSKKLCSSIQLLTSA